MIWFYILLLLMFVIALFVAGRMDYKQHKKRVEMLELQIDYYKNAIAFMGCFESESDE